MTTIETYVTRTKVDLENPTVDMIDLRDIAHALAQINRFTGHACRPYSVAEHCNIGFGLIGREFALEWMLHDAPEAYLGDVSGPLKGIIGPRYRELEAKFEVVIATKFGLVVEAHPLVKEVDRRMLVAEQQYIIHELNMDEPPMEMDVRILAAYRDQPSGSKETRFLRICHELIEERYLKYLAWAETLRSAGT